MCRCPSGVTDASLLSLARSLPQLTQLRLAEAQQLSAGGVAAALPLLPCLAQLDLTCCWQMPDDEVVELLLTPTGSGECRRSCSAASYDVSAGDAVRSPPLGPRPDSGRCCSGRSGIALDCSAAIATAANVQLPQGGISPTGSPFRRRLR